MSFPVTRLRRLRLKDSTRRLVREFAVSRRDLVMPLFVREGIEKPVEIKSMPGFFQLPLEAVVEEARQIEAAGLPAVLLFGIPEKKDAKGSQAYAPEGIVQRALRAVKKAAPELTLIADTCLCEYTADGQCGIFKNGIVDNDSSLELLGKTALSQAEAGADLVAPSAMMDGQVGVIREMLDQDEYFETGIMAYSVKYASAFYGPFREAAGSGGNFKGNRRNHQMDPSNRREALREAAEDAEEGADILMVKPAWNNLDVIADLREHFPHPIAAYNVSGEYAMLKMAAQAGYFSEEAAVKELLTSIKRAGADLIITYHAKEAAEGNWVD